LEAFIGADVAVTMAVANTQESSPVQLGSAVGLHSEIGSGRAQAASFVKAEALWTLGKQQEARKAWQECADAGERCMALTALCAWKRVQNADKQDTETAISALIQIAEKPQSRSPELFWLAAFTKYYAGQYDSAMQLALEAIKLGCYSGECPPLGRIHSDEARFEWPLDVLYYSLVKLGQAAGAEEAKEQRDMAKADRLAHKALAAV
jgi:tetratricopeptide (TPR) repeat protein